MSREIDRKIAVLMGYKLFEMDGTECIETVYGFESGEVFVTLPEYSEDWDAMRELVEWLQGKGLKVTLNIFPFDEEDVDSVFCHIFEHVKYGWKPLYESWGETAPLALCQAVLSLPPEVLNND